MPPGDENCPSSEPYEPNLKAKVPLGWKTWMRWLPVSATAIRSSPSSATPFGDENCPSSEPYEPNAWEKVPLGWKTWMRWLPVSATTTFPPG